MAPESKDRMPKDDSNQSHQIGDYVKSSNESIQNQTFLRVPLNPAVNGHHRHRDEIINEKRSVKGGKHA